MKILNIGCNSETVKALAHHHRSGEVVTAANLDEARPIMTDQKFDFIICQDMDLVDRLCKEGEMAVGLIDAPMVILEGSD